MGLKTRPTPSSTFTRMPEFRSALSESLITHSTHLPQMSLCPSVLMDFLLHQHQLILGLRASETVHLKAIPMAKAMAKAPPSPSGTAPHWLCRCSLTFPSCPSVHPKNCLSGVLPLIMPCLYSRDFRGLLTLFVKVTLLSTALRAYCPDLGATSRGSHLAAFPWSVHPNVRLPGWGLPLLFYQIRFCCRHH